MEPAENDRQDTAADRKMSTPQQTCEPRDTPLVSVVMVVCNVDRFLAESIESVLGQTFGDFEFIIMDFGSSDLSKAIASGYAAHDGRIRLHDTPHCGLVEARNAACSLARGQYIAIMDADDVSLPDRLQREIDFMETNPGFGVVGGAAEWIDARGKVLFAVENPIADQEIKSALVTHCPFTHTSLLIRTEAFALVGGYRNAFALSHDYDLCLRISEHFACANLKGAVVKYRVHPHQLSLSKRKRQTFCKLAAQASASSRKTGSSDPLNAVEEITPVVLARLGVTEATQQADLFADYLSWIMNLSAAGEYPDALKATVEALQSNWEFIERRKIAHLYYTSAQLYFRQKSFGNGFLAVCRAVMTQPAIAKRLGEGLLWRLGRIRSRKDDDGAPRSVEGPRSTPGQDDESWR
jgi:glycosyltransferase involved in cell wall biosynthesis